MGVCYIYLNLDRNEYFSVGALGGGMKASAVGRNLEGRALGLLLMEHPTRPSIGVGPGAWAGNRLAVTGDGDTPTTLAAPPDRAGETLFDHARKHGRDITEEVALMMLADNPAALLDAAAENDRLFLLLGDLAQIGRRQPVERALRERFGKDWLKTYGRKSQRR